MASRAPVLTLAAFAVLALSACSTTAGAEEAPSGTGGMIEMAISESCIEGSDSQCVSINGTSVVLPTSFEEAGIKDSSVAEDGQNMVDVTFNDEGTKVFQRLTKEAADAGVSVRLVIRIGGELQASVLVLDAMTGDQAQLGFSSEVNAQEMLEQIQAGS
ncbi:hypothetical protein E3O42_04095 [Cryobacterium adonitolivorans]|uniref:Preprotein translocase subunit SecD n=1 Tax=Cryobacterium adonitolivorans TaxID=1259189 RepID=A0A4V3ID55_9MICO|nr:hypothetical protein [Cryobacterium adonitolivorans]TFC05043.1 hypothetical protein E3O42_04095 [Cryobacterium adonitolivorans]